MTQLSNIDETTTPTEQTTTRILQGGPMMSMMEEALHREFPVVRLPGPS